MAIFQHLTRNIVTILHPCWSVDSVVGQAAVIHMSRQMHFCESRQGVIPFGRSASGKGLKLSDPSSFTKQSMGSSAVHRLWKGEVLRPREVAALLHSLSVLIRLQSVPLDTSLQPVRIFRQRSLSKYIKCTCSVEKHQKMSRFNQNLVKNLKSHQSCSLGEQREVLVHGNCWPQAV